MHFSVRFQSSQTESCPLAFSALSVASALQKAKGLNPVPTDSRNKKAIHETAKLGEKALVRGGRSTLLPIVLVTDFRALPRCAAAGAVAAGSRPPRYPNDRAPDR